MSEDPLAQPFVQSLQPRVLEILRDPNVDLNSISAKRIRSQLIEEQSNLEEPVKKYKKNIDVMIIEMFHQVQEEKEPQAKEEGGSESEINDTPEPAASSQPLAAQEAKDAAYARKLAKQWDAAESSKRATRNGRSSSSSRSSRPKSSGAATSRSSKLSSAYVADSDEELEGGAAASGFSDDDASDAAPSRAAASKKASKRKKRATNSDDEFERPKKKATGGFNREWKLSPAMAVLCQAPTCSRPQVCVSSAAKMNPTAMDKADNGPTVSRIWAHVKENGLQNPKNKREFQCDEVLFNVFGTKKIDGFKMNKFIGDHLVGPIFSGLSSSQAIADMLHIQQEEIE